MARGNRKERGPGRCVMSWQKLSDQRNANNAFAVFELLESCQQTDRDLRPDSLLNSSPGQLNQSDFRTGPHSQGRPPVARAATYI